MQSSSVKKQQNAYFWNYFLKNQFLAKLSSNTPLNLVTIKQ